MIVGNRIVYRYRSTSSDQSSNCARSVLICVISLGDLTAQCACIGAQRLPQDCSDEKYFRLMLIVLETRRLPAVAISANAFELQICSHESSNINIYFVPLFLNDSLNSKFTL